MLLSVKGNFDNDAYEKSSFFYSHEENIVNPNAVTPIFMIIELNTERALQDSY